MLHQRSAGQAYNPRGTTSRKKYANTILGGQKSLEEQLDKIATTPDAVVPRKKNVIELIVLSREAWRRSAEVYNVTRTMYEKQRDVAPWNALQYFRTEFFHPIASKLGLTPLAQGMWPHFNLFDGYHIVDVQKPRQPNKIAYVAFRGTDTPDDFVLDLDARKTNLCALAEETKDEKESNLFSRALCNDFKDISMHNGFVRSVLAGMGELLPMLRQWQKDFQKAYGEDEVATLVICGHSLGGAMATAFAIGLCALESNGNFPHTRKFLFTFGQPRVVTFNGKAEVVQLLHHPQHGVEHYLRFQKADTCVRSLTDFVTHLPPEAIGYVHIGTHITLPVNAHFFRTVAKVIAKLIVTFVDPSWNLHKLGHSVIEAVVLRITGFSIREDPKIVQKGIAELFGDLLEPIQTVVNHLHSVDTYFPFAPVTCVELAEKARYVGALGYFLLFLTSAMSAATSKKLEVLGVHLKFLNFDVLLFLRSRVLKVLRSLPKDVLTYMRTQSEHDARLAEIIQQSATVSDDDLEQAVVNNARSVSPIFLLSWAHGVIEHVKDFITSSVERTKSFVGDVLHTAKLMQEELGPV